MGRILIHLKLKINNMKNNTPYVVSADIQLLLSQWVLSMGFILPSKVFFDHLRKEFSKQMKGLFPYFDFVSEDEMSEGIDYFVSTSSAPVLSLERVYSHNLPQLNITRVVDQYGNDMGVNMRSGSSEIMNQFTDLRKYEFKEVALLDDVIFSGNLICEVVDILGSMGIKVSNVYAGIGIGEGVSKITQKTQVQCVRHYDSVIDQVCERDFYPGVPYSGRSLVGGDNVGMPYVLPFGKPAKWALIPTNFENDFSKFCIEQTILLFEEIQNLSGKKVLCSDLDRKVFGLPMGAVSFVEALKESLEYFNYEKGGILFR